MSTFMASADKAAADSRWHIIDADGQVLGRIATVAARLIGAVVVLSHVTAVLVAVAVVAAGPAAVALIAA